MPGFWFTTFSYALSLLRPEIIHDLELTKHGFMPLLMSSSFAPTEDGDYLWLGQDHGQNLKEIARHSKHDADAYNQYAHDMEMVCRAIKPLHGLGAAGPVQRRPGRAAGARRARRAVPGHGQADAPQHGPAADRQRRGLPRRLLRVGHPQGLPRVVEHHRHQGRAVLAGLRAGAAVPLDRRARRRVRRVGLPQARQRRLHPGAGARGALVRGGDRARVAGRQRHHEERPGDRRRAGGRDRVPRHDRGQRPGPAADVPRARQPARAADRPRRDHHAVPLPGHLVQGQLRARRAAGAPGAPRPRRPVPRLHQHRTVDGVPRARLSTTRSTAGTASGRTWTARSSRPSTPTWRRPAST